MRMALRGAERRGAHKRFSGRLVSCSYRDAELLRPEIVHKNALLGPARPRPRKLALDSQEYLRPQDQPLPGTLYTKGPTARLAGAYRRFRCRNARTFRKNRPEFGAGRPPRCVEPSIHGSSQQSPVPWQFCSRPPPTHLRFFRSRCSPSLAFWRAQPAFSLRRPGNLQVQSVSYNLSSPTI